MHEADIEKDLTTLREIINVHADNIFVPSYVADTPLETRQAEALGILIAEWAENSTEKILRVSLAAIEAVFAPAETATIEMMIRQREEAKR